MIFPQVCDFSGRLPSNSFESITQRPESLRLQMVIVVLKQNGQEDVVRVSPRVDAVQGGYVAEHAMLNLVDIPKTLGCPNTGGLKLIRIACGDGHVVAKDRQDM